MDKKKGIRIAGFAGALCASAALVSLSVSGTGAYFTDSHSGEVDAGTGHVRVNVDPADGKLHFDNLLPGDYKDQTITYTADGTSGEDIWLVFPTTGGPGGTNPSEAFTGAPDDGFGGGLGRYGHFAVTSTVGAHFTSYNLSANRADDHSAPCPTNANGWGGSNQQATDKNDFSPAYCPAPNAILLASNKTAGQVGSATLTFGFTPLLTGPQDAPENKLVSYQIVATQHGVRPDDPNNG
jgi:predicted ribosomally synthesized peptide with SipW-like signal peptide